MDKFKKLEILEAISIIALIGIGVLFAIINWNVAGSVCHHDSFCQIVMYLNMGR